MNIEYYVLYIFYVYSGYWNKGLFLFGKVYQCIFCYRYI